ncbi:MAG: polyphosphate:AMP phosphotransferase [Gemmatimonadaceae bacterium]|nr:polyphosphate:AMP phosphotransferase [Gemmatimonadaceae bacterium]
MFTSAERREHRIPDERYDELVPSLRSALLSAHFGLRESKESVIVIVSGVDGAGKGDLVHQLNEWLDPRGVETHAFWELTDEERARPEMWRYWRAMPGRGRVGILFGSWYTRPIIERVYKQRKRRSFEAALERIQRFERMLTDGGTRLVKLWLHLAKAEQKKRLEELEAADRLGPDDWKHFKLYKRFREVSEHALQRTHSREAPWTVLDARDRRYREVTAGKALLAALQASRPRRSSKAAAAKTRKAAVASTRDYTPAASRLDSLDGARKLAKATYERELADLQGRLSTLAWQAREARHATVLVFEGWDAAGKGSAIRRVTQAMDPRLYRVVGIAAPTDEERRQHYLWRFWRHVPRDGSLVLFDRSWYGRVLVERVEGFASVPEWDRSYGEINDFESQLTGHGATLAKFWLQVSPEEQLRRFRERQRVAWKRHKITDEDWRNREKYPAYLEAVEEMLARCSPPSAPWTLVAANDKRHARISILRTIVGRLEEALRR